jgi:proteasome alpha subunit
MMGPQAQMGYDRAITVFSPDGRLFQVEYAREAVKRGTTAIGIKSSEGVVLLVDKRITSNLLIPDSIEKIFKVDDHIAIATSGLVADSRVLVDRARLECQINKLTYDEPIRVEGLAKKISDHKQQYTQYGGVRPYGAALLIAGIDNEEARLFETDPSGALMEYLATSIGEGRDTVLKILEERIDPEKKISFEDSIFLGLECLYEISKDKLNADTIEIGYILLKDAMVRKMESKDVREYVEKVKFMHKDDMNIENKDEQEDKDETE